MHRLRYNSVMESPAPEANESRPRHLLPFFALASSLVLCCPMTSLMGFVLGLIALRRIQASGGALGGRKIAKTAMILGLVMVPVQYFILDSFQKLNERLLQEGLEDSMSILFDVESVQRDDDLLRIFSTLEGRRPSGAEIKTFVDEALSSLGAYQGLSVIRSTPGDSGFLDQSYEVAVGFRFSDRTVTGGLECLVIPSGTSMPHAVLFQRIELQIEPELTLQLPPLAPDQVNSTDETDVDSHTPDPGQPPASSREES